MAPKHADRPQSPWRSPQVLAAVVAAFAAVTVAVVNIVGGEAGGNGGGEEPPRPVVELVSTGTEPVEPPPGVTYWFEGRVAGMASNHRVFVLRMTPDDAGAPPGDSTTVSPPASYLPGDRWRVDWTFTAPPVTARFAAVLAELPLTSDSGHPGLPGETSGPVVPTSGTSAARPSADDTTSQTLRDRLLRAGPEPYVVARDEVTLAQP